MSFWDSSALVPLLLPEARTAEMETLGRADAKPAIWWATPVECQSAISRHHREASLPLSLLDQAASKLARVLNDAHVVGATDDVRERAGRLLATHPLRASDALQLAAALLWCEEKPAQARFVCLDDRLREAARREGFTILPAD